ncbi:hypothetical protein D3C76_1282040 [compost metagenome]
MIVRAAGFFAFNTMLTATLPPMTSALVQVTVIWTGRDVGASLRQTLPKSSESSVPLEIFQVCSAPWWAVIVLEISCGSISFTGMETSRAPAPPVSRSSARRLACSDEPGNRCDPRANRP